jgi:flagellar protein FlaF
MSLRAYQRTAERSENPRETEYRLFGEVTRALIEAQASRDVQVRAAALDWNRRLWTLLAADCTGAGNRLSKEVRAQIVSLSLWVGRHTSKAIRQEEDIQPLIDVNRSIMEGLRS